MRRRTFLMAAVLAMGAARAQAKQLRIGILHPAPLSQASGALPRARNFLVLSDVHSRDQVAAAQAAAEASGVRMTLVEFSNPPYDFAPAFAAARKARADGVVTLASPVLFARREELSALLLKH